MPSDLMDSHRRRVDILLSPLLSSSSPLLYIKPASGTLFWRKSCPTESVDVIWNLRTKSAPIVIKKMQPGQRWLLWKISSDARRSNYFWLYFGTGIIIKMRPDLFRSISLIKDIAHQIWKGFAYTNLDEFRRYLSLPFEEKNLYDLSVKGAWNTGDVGCCDYYSFAYSSREIGPGDVFRTIFIIKNETRAPPSPL